jgi:RND family efflux transporter MFP subunit
MSESRASSAPRGRRGFFRRRSVWLALVGLLVVGSLVAMRQRSGDAAGKLDKSLTATVKRSDLEVVVLETGRVEPRLQTQIKSRVGGQVVDVVVQEGERVKKGQVLLHIEPTDYRREVARMEAETSQSREAVGYADIQLARAEKAHAGNIAPAAELDQARHEAAMARGRQKAAEVALATARDRLRYTEIDAPFDGTLIQRNIQPGEVVVPGVTATVEGKPLMVLADISMLIVKIDLNQIDVAKVRMGQKTEVTLDALPGKKFTASVTRVAAASSISVRTGQGSGPDVFPVETTLEPSQDLAEIKPGMTADARILVEKRPRVLVLPIEAITTEKGKSFAQVIDSAGRAEPKVVRREVSVGARNDREVEITSGLKEGELVMIKPPTANEVKM